MTGVDPGEHIHGKVADGEHQHEVADAARAVREAKAVKTPPEIFHSFISSPYCVLFYRPGAGKSSINYEHFQYSQKVCAQIGERC